MKPNNEKLEILLEEYRVVSNDLLEVRKAEYSSAASTVAIISSLLLIYVSSSRDLVPIWFALTPFPFVVLAFHQFSLSIRAVRLENIIKKVISPKIKSCFSDNDEDFTPFLWEIDYSKNDMVNDPFIIVSGQITMMVIQLFVLILVMSFYLKDIVDLKPFRSKEYFIVAVQASLILVTNYLHLKLLIDSIKSNQ